jgi:hypothetical protein
MDVGSLKGLTAVTDAAARHTVDHRTAVDESPADSATA